MLLQRLGLYAYALCAVVNAALLDMAPSSQSNGFFACKCSTALDPPCCSNSIHKTDPGFTDVLHATTALIKGFISTLRTFDMIAALVLSG